MHFPARKRGTVKSFRRRISPTEQPEERILMRSRAFMPEISRLAHPRASKRRPSTIDSLVLSVRLGSSPREGALGHEGRAGSRGRRSQGAFAPRRGNPRRCQATALHGRPGIAGHLPCRALWSAAARRRLPSQRSGRTPLGPGGRFPSQGVVLGGRGSRRAARHHALSRPPERRMESRLQAVKALRRPPRRRHQGRPGVGARWSTGSRESSTA